MLRDGYRFAALVVVLISVSACLGREQNRDAVFQVYAIEYARSPKFRKSTVVHQAPRDEFTAFSWFAWLISGHGRIVLVDTGYDEPAAADGFGVERFRPVPELLAGLKIEPEQVTDVIITHLHFDHAGNAGPYSNARFWVQRAEIDWARSRVDEREPRRSGVRLRDVRLLGSMKDEGRLKIVNGDAAVAEGILLHRGGGHTPGLQWVEIRTGSPTGTIVLAADNAYLYENVTERRPTGSTRDVNGDRLLLKKLLVTASNEKLVVPGHDPAVMSCFPLAAPNIVEIRDPSCH